MIVSRRFAEEPTIAFRDQPTTVGHRPSTELRRQAMPTNVGVRVFYMPPPPAPPPAAPAPQPSTATTIPSKHRAAVAAAAPTIPRPAAQRVTAAPSRVRRFLSLVAVCFIAMMFGVGLGFMVREGQARASSSSASTTNHRVLHVEDAQSVRVLVSLGPETKIAPPPARRLARVVVVKSSSSPAVAPASFDDFEPSFRVSP